MKTQNKISLFRKRGFYILLTVIFTLLLAADILLGLLPVGMGNMAQQNVPFSDGGQMAGMQQSGAMEMPEGMEAPDGMEMPEDMEMPQRGQASDDRTEFSEIETMQRGEQSLTSGADVLRWFKSAWLPIAVILALLDAASVFMLVRNGRQRKQRKEQPNMEPLYTDGEIHIARKPVKKTRSGWRWVAPIALVAAICLLVQFLSGTNTQDISRTQASILSGTAEIGTLSQSLPGSGTLTENAAEVISLVSGVEIEKWYVSDGDIVAVGDKLALVDRVSVMSAIAQLQDTIDLLDEALEACEDAEVDDQITLPVDGRIKEIFAQEGISVTDTIYEHGCLMLVSLDGLMAVSLEAQNPITAGDGVTVTRSDGTELTGRVESFIGGTAVITVSDEQTIRGETVSVTTEDGTVLGSGELYIHSEWKLTAFTGVVDDIRVDVNEQVDSGDTVIKLSDTAYTGEYETLLGQRQTLESQMLELFKLYQEEYLYAQAAGMVSGIEEYTLSSLSAVGSDFVIEYLANAPGSDPDAAYVNYIGTVTAMEEGVWQINLYPNTWDITDYTQLEQLQLSKEDMSLAVSLTPDSSTPVYVDSHIGWVTGSLNQISVGSTLLFAFDPLDSTRLVWIIALDASTNDSNPSSPSGSSGGGSGGSSPASAGTTDQENTQESYEIEDIQILTITSQEEMEITITVDELDILLVSVGQEAHVTLDAMPGQAFTGTVTEVSAQGSNSGGNSKFTAVITIPRAENMLPGMNASVSVCLDTQEAVLVPVDALVELDGKTYLYTIYNEDSGVLGGAVEVTTGLSDGQKVQIVSGISDGENFYYEYLDTVNYTTAVAQAGTNGGFNIGSMLGSGRRNR